MIDHLPKASEFWHEVSQDEALVPPGDSKAEPRRPRVSEWSLEADQLASIHDVLANILRVTVQAHSGPGVRPPKMVHYPRPETAAERVKKRRGRDAWQFLHDRLKPAGYDD